jgi:hypothetical protein
MSTIVTRSGKGSPLTNNEVDANFTNLNTDKAELSGATFTGEITANGGIALGDADRATFGASDDLQIYHSSSDSRIVDSGTGNLLIQSTNLRLQSAGGEQFVVANENGAVSLYYDNAAKLATASGGITVTGEVAATSLDISGNIDVDGVTNLDVVDIDGAVDMASSLTLSTNNNAISMKDASGGTTRMFILNSGNTTYLGPVDSYAGGQIFYGASANVTGHVMNVGGADRFNVGSSAVVVNETSADVDFRVESNNNTHMLFVDGGNNRVGVGVGTPENPLHINDTSATSQLLIQGDSNDASIKFNKSGQTFVIGIDATDNSFRFSDGTTLGSGDRLTIASDGAATFAGAITANAGVVVDNITIDGSDIRSTGSLFLDSDGANIYMSDGGTDIGLFSLASQDLTIRNLVSNKDINFQLNNGGTNFTAFSLDANLAGKATFNAGATFGSHTRVNGDFSVSAASGEDRFAILPQSAGSGTIVFSGNEGLTGYEPLTIDFETLALRTSGTPRLSIASSGAATFSSSVAADNYGFTQNSSASGIQDAIFRSTTGRIEIRAGNVDDMLVIDGTNGVIVNDGGVDRDFRVESNNNGYALYVDGGTDTVSIGTAATDAKFRVDASNADLRIGYASGYNYFDADVANVYRVGTSSVEAMKMTTGEIVLNEAGADRDFRVESDTNTHALFVEGSGNNVGIGTSTLTSSSGYHTLSLNGSTGGQLSFQTGGSGKHFIFSSATDLNMYSAVDGALRFSTNNLERLEMTSSSTIFNDIGADADFRIESNDNANMFHVDAGSNGVGIGTTGNGPTPLTVNGGTATAATIQLGNHGDNAGIHAKYSLAIKADSTEAISDRSIEFKIGTHQAFYSNVAGTVFNEGGHTSDFRVEGDADSNMFHVSGGANTVSVGTSSNISTSRFEVQGIDDRHNIGQKSFNLIAGTSHSCKTVEGVMAYNTASSGSQLSIPITSQGNQHRPALIELTFLSAEYNTSGNVKAGFVRLAFQSLTSIGSLAELDKSGNVASISSSGMNILVNFTSAYTAGQSDHEGVMCYYRIVHEQPQYVKMWDATLN